MSSPYNGRMSKKMRAIYMSDEDFQICTKFAGPRNFSQWASRVLVSAVNRSDEQPIRDALVEKAHKAMKEVFDFDEKRAPPKLPGSEGMGLFALPALPPPLPKP